MNFKNTAVLAILALLTADAEETYLKIVTGNVVVHEGKKLDGKNEATILGLMAAKGIIPLTGLLSKAEEFGKAASRDTTLFAASTDDFYQSFGHFINNHSGWTFCQVLKNADLDAMATKIAAGLNGASKAVATTILKYAEVNEFPMDKTDFQSLLGSIPANEKFGIPLHKLNKLTDATLDKASYAEQWATYFNKHDILHIVDRKIVKKILSNAAAAKKLKKDCIKNLAKNSDTASLLTKEAVANLTDTEVKDLGKHVRNLPSEAFAAFEGTLGKSDLQFLTEKQISNYQKSLPTSKPVTLDPLHCNPLFAHSINKDVWLQICKDSALSAKAKDWRFWRRIPNHVFKKALGETNFVSTVPWKNATILKSLSKSQRQTILDNNDKLKCDELSEGFFKAKQSRVDGLSASEDCFKQVVGMPTKSTAAGVIMAGVRCGAFKPSHMKELKADVVKEFKTKVPRPEKKDEKGEVIKRDKDERDYEFTGVLAFEYLKQRQNGADYVKEFQCEERETDVKTVCKAISDLKMLRRATWLQPLLGKTCVRAITVGSIDKSLKKLSTSIWSQFSKKQLEEIGIKDMDSNLEEFTGPFMEGLTANRAFAKTVTYIHEKEDKKNKDSDEMKKVCMLKHFKDEVLRQYFGHKFVANVPDDDEHMPMLVQFISKLSDDALASASAAWVTKHKAVYDAARPEQRARVSNAVDATGSYPASFVSATSVPDEILTNMSSTFMSRLNDSVLNGLTKDQVAKIPAEAFCLLCGEKAKALKVELSAEQRAQLGKNCAAAATSEEKSESTAPSNAKIGAFAAVAAAAAGSLALFL